VRERGSALLLVPAAMLVVLGLAGVVLDASAAFLAERELADAAAAAANDVAGAALDESGLRRDGTVQLDEARACELARATLLATGNDLVTDALARDPCPVHLGDDGLSVEVELHAEARAIFGGGLPGLPDGYAVSARRRAVLVG